MHEYTEIIGLIAGACTTFSFLPQIYKIWRERSAKDISINMYIAYCIGLSIWVLYGFLLSAPAIIVANGVTLIFAFLILIMKIMWG